MTTPTTQTPEQFREELRQLFTDQAQRLHELRVEFIEMREELHTMREGLTHAATPPGQVGTFQTMIIDTIVMTYDDNGKLAYKGLGAPFQKFGVRIWDEIIPQFTDPASLKPGKNPITPTPAHVQMNEAQGDKPAQPRKVTGKA